MNMSNLQKTKSLVAWCISYCIKIAMPNVQLSEPVECRKYLIQLNYMYITFQTFKIRDPLLAVIFLSELYISVLNLSSEFAFIYSILSVACRLSD